MKKLKVLFICKDSAIRSAMAGAFLNAYFSDRYEATAAGIDPLELNPYAIKALKEIGIDASLCSGLNQIEELRGKKFDCVVTLCEYAKTFSSKFPEHQKQLHKSFKDCCNPTLCSNAKKCPYSLPENKGTEKDSLNAFRYLREAIFEWIEKEAIF